MLERLRKKYCENLTYREESKREIREINGFIKSSSYL